MKLLVLVAIAACSLAQPSTLDHPTPINPSVLIETKPAEKIILISDVNEIAKYKRETSKPLYPTLLPEIKFHHITKRDYNNVHERKLVPDTNAAVGQLINKRSQRELQTTSHEHSHEVDSKVGELHQLVDLSTTASGQHKRDIPVPLVAKHKHPEVSEQSGDDEELKDINNEHKHPSNKDTNQEHEHQSLHPEKVINDSKSESSTEHPVIRPKLVPVAELLSRHHEKQE